MNGLERSTFSRNDWMSDYREAEALLQRGKLTLDREIENLIQRTANYTGVDADVLRSTFIEFIQANYKPLSDMDMNTIASNVDYLGGNRGHSFQMIICTFQTIEKVSLYLQNDTIQNLENKVVFLAGKTLNEMATHLQKESQAENIPQKVNEILSTALQTPERPLDPMPTETTGTIAPQSFWEPYRVFLKNAWAALRRYFSDKMEAKTVALSAQALAATSADQTSAKQTSAEQTRT